MAKKRVGRYPEEFRRMAIERLKNCDNILALSRELGGIGVCSTKRNQLEPVDAPTESLPQNSREFILRKEGAPAEATAGGKDDGAGFFQRCLANGRGSTPAGRKLWRNGIYDEVQEVMALQGNLGVERMFQLAQVSRAGFYRYLQEETAVEEDMNLRSAIQQIALEHRRR